MGTVTVTLKYTFNNIGDDTIKALQEVTTDRAITIRDAFIDLSTTPDTTELIAFNVDDNEQPYGLKKLALRGKGVTDEQCPMTGAEFAYLKQHPSECPPHLMEKFSKELEWEANSNRAKKAVQTKRKKYTSFPTRANTHRVKA